MHRSTGCHMALPLASTVVIRSSGIGQTHDECGVHRGLRESMPCDGRSACRAAERTAPE